MVTIMFIEKKTYKKKSTAKIVLDFKKVHKDTYIYDEVEYLGSNEKVKIRCRKHGVGYFYNFHFITKMEKAVNNVGTKSKEVILKK